MTEMVLYGVSGSLKKFNFFFMEYAHKKVSGSLKTLNTHYILIKITFANSHNNIIGLLCYIRHFLAATSV